LLELIKDIPGSIRTRNFKKIPDASGGRQVQENANRGKTLANILVPKGFKRERVEFTIPDHICRA
jgi:hypothetical protein